MAITATGSTNVESMLASLGLNRAFAEQLGNAAATKQRDPAAMQALLYSMYASLNLNNNQIGNGSAIPPSGFVQRPGDYALQTMGGAQAIPPTGQGFGGLSGDAPFGNSPWARSLQVAALQSPEFRASIEKALGGQMLANGAGPDGGLSVWRGGQPRVGGLMRAAMQQGMMPRTGFAGVIGSMNIPLAGNAMAQTGVTSPILKGLQSMEANIMSTVQGFSGGQGQNSTMQAMAQKLGINMQTANFEDIVYLSMMNYSANKEKEVSGKINDLSKTTPQAQTAGGVSANALPAGEDEQDALAAFGGILGRAGGTTAAQMGIQAQAPAGTPFIGQAQMAGTPGQVLDAQGNVVGDPAKMSDTMKQQMLQKMMGDLQKMYEMLSNMIKSMHDMQMNPIRNLRG